jgi:4-nitrophenyl phosphatase
MRAWFAPALLICISTCIHPILTERDMTANLADIHYLLIDMDGVLYRGRTALPGGPELLAFLDARRIGYLLVTNNSTLSPASFAARLEGMGLHVDAAHIMTSGVATAQYLATIAPAGARVNVVGEPGLAEQMQLHGFTVVADRHADYVVAGWDKTLTYEKLKNACLAIRDGAKFIGTNADKTYPLENDIIPGAGSILAALIASTDVQPLVVGKPEPIMIAQCLRLLGARAEETAMLGDRMDTDILGGYRAGTKTILVLTGISTLDEVARWDIKPDWTYGDLPALLAEWRASYPD